MNVRITETIVHFKSPFKLEGFNEDLPSGSYKVETEEERIDGLSFSVYLRTEVRLHLHANPQRPGTSRTLVLKDPSDFDRAQIDDKQMDQLR